MPPPDEIPSAPLVGVWHFSRLAEAREAALALAARGLLYEIDSVGRGWVLLVEEHATDEALRELASVELTEAGGVPAEAPPPEPIRAASLIVPALVMSAFFQVQMWLGERWTEAGLADGQAMLGKGEWWRAITALTLHGDLGHFLANLMTGLMFAVFLQAEMGAAWRGCSCSPAVRSAMRSTHGATAARRTTRSARRRRSSARWGCSSRRSYPRAGVRRPRGIAGRSSCRSVPG